MVYIVVDDASANAAKGDPADAADGGSADAAGSGSLDAADGGSADATDGDSADAADGSSAALLSKITSTSGGGMSIHGCGVSPRKGLTLSIWTVSGRARRLR